MLIKTVLSFIYNVCFHFKSFQFSLHCQVYFLLLSYGSWVWKVTCSAKVAVKMMLHVLSSQLLRPTIAKTESPRKEQACSLWLMLMMSLPIEWHHPIMTHGPLRVLQLYRCLIDLKISSHICWPFRAETPPTLPQLLGVVLFWQPNLTGPHCTNNQAVRQDS